MYPSHLRVYIVNLPRRVDRKRALAKQLPNDLRVTYTSDWPLEFDGRMLSCCALRHRGVRFFPWRVKSSNPWWSRDLLMGEIGCAMAHLQCWRDAADHADWQHILVMEDDARLAIDFWEYLDAGLAVLRNRNIPTDLIYAGRKVVGDDRPLIRGFVSPGFSYTTVAYLLNRLAVTRLLATRYERSLIPLDEFLPAMYMEHPRPDVALRFPPQVPAVAFSPEIVNQAPRDAFGSDTEESAPLELCLACQSQLRFTSTD